MRACVSEHSNFFFSSRNAVTVGNNKSARGERSSGAPWQGHAPHARARERVRGGGGGRAPRIRRECRYRGREREAGALYVCVRRSLVVVIVFARTSQRTRRNVDITSRMRASAGWLTVGIGGERVNITCRAVFVKVLYTSHV